MEFVSRIVREGGEVVVRYKLGSFGVTVMEVYNNNRITLISVGDNGIVVLEFGSD
jgi:hypothetical protein